MIIEKNKTKFWGIKTMECNDCGKDVDIKDIQFLYTEIDEVEGAYCKQCIIESHIDELDQKEMNEYLDRLNKILDKADARFK